MNIFGRGSKKFVKLRPSSVFRDIGSGRMEPITLEEVVEEFLSDLARPSVLKPAPHVDSQRTNAITALTVIKHFLWRLDIYGFTKGELSSVGVTLQALAHSLQDLRVGTTAPILAAQKAHNRSILPTETQMARAHAAAAMEALIRAGEERSSAARAVVKEVKGWDGVFGARSLTPTWKVVARWRDDFRKRTRGKTVWDSNMTMPEIAYLGLILHWKEVTAPEHANYVPMRECALQLVRMRT